MHGENVRETFSPSIIIVIYHLLEREGAWAVDDCQALFVLTDSMDAFIVGSDSTALREGDITSLIDWVQNHTTRRVLVSVYGNGVFIPVANGNIEMNHSGVNTPHSQPV